MNNEYVLTVYDSCKGRERTEFSATTEGAQAAFDAAVTAAENGVYVTIYNAGGQNDLAAVCKQGRAGWAHTGTNRRTVAGTEAILNREKEARAMIGRIDVMLAQLRAMPA